jgi:hypothetical protein
MTFNTATAVPRRAIVGSALSVAFGASFVSNDVLALPSYAKISAEVNSAFESIRVSTKSLAKLPKGAGSFLLVLRRAISAISSAVKIGNAYNDAAIYGG